MATSAPGFDPSSIDLVATYLQSKRSENTRRAYASDLKLFFGDASADQVRAFLLWPPPQIAAAFQVHKNQLLEAGLGGDAINRRFLAVCSLLKFAFRLGLASCDGRNLVDKERTRTYRDTTGISIAQVKKLLAAPAARAQVKSVGLDSPLIVLRDTAILTLFCMNGLRCNEVRLAEASDFNLFDRRLQVLGKGRGIQKEPITLNMNATLSTEMYLRVAGHREGALFRNLDHNPGNSGQRLANRSLYRIVQSYGAQIGCPDLHPHKLRHTAITQMLIKNKGDITAAMEFSRHLDPKVLMRYFHNSRNLQGDMTDLLGDLFAAEPKSARKKRALQPLM